MREAAARFKRVVGADVPREVVHWAERGHAALAQGNLDEAEDLLAKVVQSAPGSSSLLHDLALVYEVRAAWWRYALRAGAPDDRPVTYVRLAAMSWQRYREIASTDKSSIDDAQLAALIAEAEVDDKVVAAAHTRRAETVKLETAELLKKRRAHHTYPGRQHFTDIPQRDTPPPAARPWSRSPAPITGPSLEDTMSWLTNTLNGVGPQIRRTRHATEEMRWKVSRVGECVLVMDVEGYERHVAPRVRAARQGGDVFGGTGSTALHRGERQRNELDFLSGESSARRTVEERLRAGGAPVRAALTDSKRIDLRGTFSVSSLERKLG
ncbi:MAG: hypothetical protein HYZ28_11490 [Myxococcales bacterium]|nr:hypothetical protein [Myxococcales bacterium]